MKFLFVSLFSLVSMSAFANQLECLNELEELSGGDGLIILEETQSSDGHPLVLELSDLTIYPSTLRATVNSVGRKEGSSAGIVTRRTTGNFDITQCRIRNQKLEFKMGSVRIKQLSSEVLRASVLTWSSEFEVID